MRQGSMSPACPNDSRRHNESPTTTWPQLWAPNSNSSRSFRKPGGPLPSPGPHPVVIFRWHYLQNTHLDEQKSTYIPKMDFSLVVFSLVKKITWIWKTFFQENRGVALGSARVARNGWLAKAPPQHGVDIVGWEVPWFFKTLLTISTRDLPGIYHNF